MQNNEQETIYDSAAIKKIAVRVSWVSIIVNALLSFGKLLAGLLAASGAMVSDAVHSASDVISSV
ncbi:MAG: cation transporter, partial [Firmicutes bacterium]|nr:cation transporter [Bacillota bacterium]